MMTTDLKAAERHRAAAHHEAAAEREARRDCEATLVAKAIKLESGRPEAIQVQLAVIAAKLREARRPLWEGLIYALRNRE
jgi:hypothetical protein